MGDREDSMLFSPDDLLEGEIAFEDMTSLEALSEQSLQDLDAQLEELLCLETVTSFEQEPWIPEPQEQDKSASLAPNWATKGVGTALPADTEAMEAVEAKGVEPPEETELKEKQEEKTESLEEVKVPEEAEELEEEAEPFDEASPLQEAEELGEEAEPLEEVKAPEEVEELEEEAEPLEEVKAPEEAEELEEEAPPEKVEELGEEGEFVGVEFWGALQMESSGPQVLDELHVLGLQQVQPNRLVVPEAPVDHHSHTTALPSPPVAHHTPTLSVAHHTPTLPVELASNLPEVEAIQVADAPTLGDQTSDFGQAHTTEACCDDDHVLDAPLTESRASCGDLVQELVVPQEEKSSGESHFGEKTTHPGAARRGLRRRGSSLETAHTLTQQFIADTKVHPHTQLTPLA